MSTAREMDWPNTPIERDTTKQPERLATGTLVVGEALVKSSIPSVLSTFSMQTRVE